VVADVLSVLDESAALRSDAGTAVARVYNVGREEAAELVGAVEAQYSAILDSNVCGPCLAQDGRVYRLDDPEYDAALPPNRECEGGDNCRCVMVYIPQEGAP
jgi:SPP1 gp7 family putative phage head morphogenesis protein